MARKVAQLNHEGFYLGPTEAYGKGLPGNAREEFPPGQELPENHKWRWDGEKYVITPDYRGVTVYLPDGSTYHPSAWGPLPDDHTLTAPPPPPPTPEEEMKKAIAAIDAETSAAIVAGFDMPIQNAAYHFSYDAFDQQNFSDAAITAGMAMTSPDMFPQGITWNGWQAVDGVRTLCRLELSWLEFLALYQSALTHKMTQMEIGSQRKAALYQAYEAA